MLTKRMATRGEEAKGAAPKREREQREIIRTTEVLALIREMVEIQPLTYGFNRRSGPTKEGHANKLEDRWTETVQDEEQGENRRRMQRASERGHNTQEITRNVPSGENTPLSRFKRNIGKESLNTK